MLVIGLTGGVGSGKSTVGRYFEELGIPVIDTDSIARQVVEPGRPALAEIRDRFGPELIRSDKQLDRKALRARVFSNAYERRALESILHPRIRAELQRQLSHLSSPYCIVAIPLLVEKAWQNEVDRVLVVDSPEQLQIRRTIQRENLDTEQVQRIIDSQASRRERLAIADDVIVNDGQRTSLEAAVLELHRRYLSLAANHPD